MDEHLMQEVPPELQVIPPAERVDTTVSVLFITLITR